MKIVTGYPPNFLEIASVFPNARAKGVVFTWGGTLFNPDGGKISRAIHAHEEMHHEQQGDDETGIAGWWQLYLTDSLFRLAQELPAHRAEYLAFCKGSVGGRSRYLQAVVDRITSPLYGSMIDRARARSLILGADGWNWKL